MFPGAANGSRGERIAHAVFSEIQASQPAVVLDLHNDWNSSIPYAVIDPSAGFPTRKTKETVENYAKRTKLIVAHEEEKTERKSWKKTLSGCLMLHGIPALTLELGSAHNNRAANMQAGIAGIWNILESLAMVVPRAIRQPFPVPKAFRKKTLVYSDKPRAQASGTLEYAVRPGTVVWKGRIIAKVLSTSGKILETLKARHDGILLGYADSKISRPDFEAFAFAVLKK